MAKRCVGIVRQESLYFYPRSETKLSNEGMGNVFWHALRIMREQSYRCWNAGVGAAMKIGLKHCWELVLLLGVKMLGAQESSLTEAGNSVGLKTLGFLSAQATYNLSTKLQ